MSDARLKRARFTDVTHDDGFDVHFNPVSLQLSLQNTLEEKGSGKSKTQYVSKSSSKLTMDLVFDTTATGGDVREHTKKVARFLEPPTEGAQKNQPPVVRFDWGTFGFQGLVEQYKETLDFFSPDGVPLRAAVNLTLASQDFVFTSQDERPAPTRQAMEYTPGAGESVTDAAAATGNGRGGRGLAAANGIESMRFPSGPLTIDPSIRLGAAVGFVGGASIGAGISASLGVGGSVGAAAGPAFGGAASAGVSASAGAFAGLRVATPRTTAQPFDTTRLLRRPASAEVAAEGRATFNLSGRATLLGAASFSADVGASDQPRAAGSRLRFHGA